jgi:lipopolysaccharide biosynthesis protein
MNSHDPAAGKAAMPAPEKPRVIAFYLPQFHPIPENDEAWGRGFTEWTNVTKAAPLFAGHYQPHVPADLGYYDLRLPEVREAQAEMARANGVEGFCYWHYWFSGSRLLERPFNEVLRSGKPDFPFCLGWANESWSGHWNGGNSDHVIKAQVYPGFDDHKNHFESLLPAFRDPRYVRVAGKPLFLIYRPKKIPDCARALQYWKELAVKAGLPGLHLVANLDWQDRDWDAVGHGFDAITLWPLGRLVSARSKLLSRRVKRTLTRRRLASIQPMLESMWPGLDRVFNYEEILPLLDCPSTNPAILHPMAVPNWDTTARYGRKAAIFHGSTPEHFRRHLRDVLQRVQTAPPDKQLVFLKSWNEWAEGNHVEPDVRFGNGYLDVLKEELSPAKKENSISAVHAKRPVASATG